MKKKLIIILISCFLVISLGVGAYFIVISNKQYVYSFTIKGAEGRIEEQSIYNAQIGFDDAVEWEKLDGNYIFSISVKGKRSGTFKVLLNEGYDFSNATLKENGKKKKSYVTINGFGGAEKTISSSERYFEFDYSKVFSSTNFVLDFSNCSWGSVSVNVENLLEKNIAYKTYLTDLVLPDDYENNTLEDLKNIDANNLFVPYKSYVCFSSECGLQFCDEQSTLDLPYSIYDGKIVYDSNRKTEVQYFKATTPTTIICSTGSLDSSKGLFTFDIGEDKIFFKKTKLLTNSTTDSVGKYVDYGFFAGLRAFKIQESNGGDRLSDVEGCVYINVNNYKNDFDFYLVEEEKIRELAENYNEDFYGETQLEVTTEQTISFLQINYNELMKDNKNYFIIKKLKADSAKHFYTVIVDNMQKGEYFVNYSALSFSKLAGDPKTKVGYLYQTGMNVELRVLNKSSVTKNADKKQALKVNFLAAWIDEENNANNSNREFTIDTGSVTDITFNGENKLYESGKPKIVKLNWEYVLKDFGSNEITVDISTVALEEGQKVYYSSGINPINATWYELTESLTLSNDGTNKIYYYIENNDDNKELEIYYDAEIVTTSTTWIDCVGRTSLNTIKIGGKDVSLNNVKLLYLVPDYYETGNAILQVKQA